MNIFYRDYIVLLFPYSLLTTSRHLYSLLHVGTKDDTEL